jgi:hypothetical protein
MFIYIYIHIHRYMIYTGGRRGGRGPVRRSGGRVSAIHAGVNVRHNDNILYG